jgi:hypothetical protein
VILNVYVPQYVEAEGTNLTAGISGMNIISELQEA